MAFVNEELTDEEREEFEAREITNPVNLWTTLSPMYWTIDREKDMCLIHAGMHRDYLDEVHFIFIVRGEIIPIVLNEFHTGEESIWSLPEDESIISGNEEFAEDLKLALIEFGLDGCPCDDPQNVRKVTVKF